MTFSDWECLEEIGDEFQVVVLPSKRFEDAIQTCSFENATLSRISNEKAFAFTFLLFAKIPRTVQDSIWIGITAIGDRSDPGCYASVDGHTDASFFNVLEGVPPWRNGNLNDGIGHD